MAFPPPPFAAPPAPFPPGGSLPSRPERFHPLSPVVRVGGAVVALFTLLVSSSFASAHSGEPGGFGLDLAFLGLTVVLGGVSWAVTTWSVDGGMLQVSTGLVRRKVVRLPLSRVQAVDVVEPWFARMLGLAEVRVRTGGGGDGDARLAYLGSGHAQAVRNALVALAHGLPHTTPEAVARPLVATDNSRLVAGWLLSGKVLPTVLLAAVEVVLVLAKQVASASSLFLYLFGSLSVLSRRVANEWGLVVSEAPDGLRVQAGIGTRMSETIPQNRIQAIRRTEPLFWRPFGWQRLELHLAGGVGRRRKQPAAVIRRALLPVGERPQADYLLALTLGPSAIHMSKPPPRARWRAPFSYHFLAAGSDGTVSAASSGRVARETEYVPLAKVQSIRFVQGPVQRMLRLATVHLDAAGRRAVVSWRHRDASEARALVDELTTACAAARSRVVVPPVVPTPARLEGGAMPIPASPA